MGLTTLGQNWVSYICVVSLLWAGPKTVRDLRQLAEISYNERSGPFRANSNRRQYECLCYINSYVVVGSRKIDRHAITFWIIFTVWNEGVAKLRSSMTWLISNTSVSIFNFNCNKLVLEVGSLCISLYQTSPHQFHSGQWPLTPADPPPLHLPSLLWVITGDGRPCAASCVGSSAHEARHTTRPWQRT